MDLIFNFTSPMAERSDRQGGGGGGRLAAAGRTLKALRWRLAAARRRLRSGRWRLAAQGARRRLGAVGKAHVEGGGGGGRAHVEERAHGLE